MGPSPSRFAPFFYLPAFTASAELRYAPVWTQQVRIERWPWPPSHWSFRSPLPSTPRCGPCCLFRRARARLHAVSRQPAAASRSAYPVACTAPACGAKPHEYPSYVPLRLTVGLDKGKVNAKGIPGRYRGNEGKGYRADLKALFQSASAHQRVETILTKGPVRLEWTFLGRPSNNLRLKIKRPAWRRRHEFCGDQQIQVIPR